MVDLLQGSSASAHNMATALGGLQSQATSGSTATQSSGSDITSTDFLTLLVSELKNQDPTQPTDPTAYVQQLVGVNSLEQLIDINKDLTGTASTSGQAAQVLGIH